MHLVASMVGRMAVKLAARTAVSLGWKLVMLMAALRADYWAILLAATKVVESAEKLVELSVEGMVAMSVVEMAN